MGSTLLAVLMLAVGIGATTAIFSVFYSVLLKPLPFPEPAQLVNLWESRTGNSSGTRRRSLRRISGTYRRAIAPFPGVASISIRSTANLIGTGEPEQIGGWQHLSGILPRTGREDGRRTRLPS